ncbi:GNAT family N-acetyltransferase [Nocardiopsis sp. EMB25]|uniref:GNAT family N-acetyltransferase n=1 Tax=Nocardiopsis sp. EMB25 TaxID=2835867 RepID=UPI00228491A6|nr:GNAT family N-acetyltransferase [Nocardiopsis sp. EMB25]MCY9785331.1 GNAT family N-acetyltransferase [Nocardiopsis sp. EMB25]
MAEPVTFTPARAEDVPAIVALIADDRLGAIRENAADLTPYLAAFEAIDDDPGELLVVGRRGDRVVATFQLSFIPGLSRGGASRAQIEAVRVHADERGDGVGADLMTWAEAEARRRGCALVQLTSDATREDAHRFYERLGYVPSHVGFKKRLD